MIEHKDLIWYTCFCHVCKSIEKGVPSAVPGDCVVCTHVNVYIMGRPKIGQRVPVRPAKGATEAYIVCHIRAEQNFPGKTHVCVARVGPWNPCGDDYMREISS